MIFNDGDVLDDFNFHGARETANFLTFPLALKRVFLLIS